MELPEKIAKVLEPVFAELPLEQAMNALVPKKGAGDKLRAVVRSVIKSPLLANNPALQSGLWLYVDELDLSHDISQTMKDATGSYWHGIMHRREGDFSNSHYWFAQTGNHPAMAALDGYDGHGLVDEVAAARPANPPDVVRRQREEWANLFAWCARQCA